MSQQNEIKGPDQYILESLADARESIQATVDWLADGARSGQRSEDVLAETCGRLVLAGIPLWRVSTFVRTLHPEVVGRRFIWQRDAGVTITEGLFELLDTDRFLHSPYLAVIKSGQAISM